MMNTVSINKIENTIAGWEKANEKYRQTTRYTAQKDPIQFLFEVTLTDNFERDGDPMNLRLFLPIYSDLGLHSNDYRLNIRFDSSISPPKNWDIKCVERIRVLLSSVISTPLYFDRDNQIAWFSSPGYEEIVSPTAVVSQTKISSEVFSSALQHAKNSYLAKFFPDNKDPENNDRISDIFDNIDIYKLSDENETKYYRNIVIRSVNDYDEFNSIRTQLNNELKAFTDEHNYLFHFICTFNKRIIISDIFSFVQITSPRDLGLQKIVKAYYAYFEDSKNYIGTKEKPIHQDQKDILRDQMLMLIKEHTNQENDLAHAVFCICTKKLLAKKGTFHFQ